MTTTGSTAAGVLVDVVALALAADPLFLGLAEDEDLAEAEEDAEDAEEEAEEDAVDAAACVGAGVVQVGFGVAPTPLLPGPAELVLVLEWGWPAAWRSPSKCRSGPGWG